MNKHSNSAVLIARRLAGMAGLATLVAAAMAITHAQEEPAEEPAAAEEMTEVAPPAAPEADPTAEESGEAETDSEALLETPEQPEMPGVAPSAKARDGDAEIMPKASKSLLLDVEDTGAGLIAVGERGHVVLSQDGKSWTQSPAPTRATLNAIDCADTSNCWAVGHDAVILNSSDGGKSWNKQYFEPELEKPFLDVMFFDSQHGIAIGAYGLFKETLDGGKTWNEFNAEVRAEEWHFNAVTRLGNGTLLLVGEIGGIVTSADNGVTWVQQESPYEGSYFGALPVGESGALIYGLRGNAYLSTDAVKGDWKQVDTGTVQGLLGGTLLPNGDYVLVGNSGIVLRGSPTTGLVKRIPEPVGKGLSTALPMPGGDVLVFGEVGTYFLEGVAN